MKRRYILILISILVITASLTFLANSGDDTIRKYPYGKDTLSFLEMGLFRFTGEEDRMIFQYYTLIKLKLQIQ